MSVVVVVEGEGWRMSYLFRGRQSAPTGEQRAVRLPAELMARMTGSSNVVAVDPDSAMRHDAVWSCRTRIAQDVSMMPVDVVRYTATGRQAVVPVPQIIAAPSVFARPLDWRYQVIDAWLGAGNAWGLVTDTTMGGLYPSRIELQSSVRVQVLNGAVKFYVNNVEHDLWPVGDLWHVPAYTLPGQLLGMSPIAYHAVTIGLGLTAENFGADYLADGGHPSALVQPEGSLTEEQATSIKARFMALTRGNREPVVMPQSVKYTPIQINPEESQFLNTMRYTVEQICRIYGEDPADHGASGGGTSLTYANRRDADLARFKRRQFWVTKLQDALGEMLPPDVTVKLNTSSALMMTTLERHELHALRLKSETTTVNEVRTLEDEPKFPDAKFDAPGIPDLLKPATTTGGAA